MSAVAVLGFPDSHIFHLGAWDVGIPIQAFGVIVATGVLVGAALLRRYAEWHGVDDLKIRELTGWITVTGFIGAHVIDVIGYQWQDVQHDPLLLIELWKGISSFGGFIGGAAGFAFYVWWKRLPPRLMADIGVVGLLAAFSIGRIGCTTVSDHIGALVDPDKWYAFLAVDYSGDVLRQHYPQVTDLHHYAWNLGLIEFLYLIPVNLVVLGYAFRPSKDRDKPWTAGRPKAGMIAVLAGILYAPVRFFLDFLRPEDSDPRHFGLTVAQWAAMAAFGVAIYAAIRIIRNGEPAEPVTRTSGEAQKQLKQIMLKGDDKTEEPAQEPAEKPAKAVAKKTRKR
ncbi:MAG TPA: prolipoprotein diacylglyceryl transferase family protein [Kofleriaceae bacterium]|jgi:phosphatidylglycerol:prolipoprotein diacylglycerol transferase